MNAIAIEIVRGLSHHHHNHTQNEYDNSVEPPQDEDTPIIFKILALLWMVFMAAICYKADQREQQENARIERRRQRRLERRLKERKLDPKRREPVVAASMKTKVRLHILVSVLSCSTMVEKCLPSFWFESIKFGKFSNLQARWMKKRSP